MSIPVKTTLDFTGGGAIAGLSAATASGQPVEFDQFNQAIEGLAWKDSARVSTQANINLAAPGATIDGVAMTANDRFIARSQTTTAENGIYIWNGAATPATRALDASTYAELEGAVVTVEEGTSAGATFRQTGVNGTIGSTAVTWTSFGTAAPSASETTAGIAEIATQAETDAGTDDLRMVTPLKLKTSPFARKPYATTIGDGSATAYVVTHNLGTDDTTVAIYETGGSKRVVLADVEHTSTNSVTIKFNVAPAAGAYRVFVSA
jgi:hypothetical protein